MRKLNWLNCAGELPRQTGRAEEEAGQRRAKMRGFSLLSVRLHSKASAAHENDETIREKKKQGAKKQEARGCERTKSTSVCVREMTKSCAIHVCISTAKNQNEQSTTEKFGCEFDCTRM